MLKNDISFLSKYIVSNPKPYIPSTNKKNNCQQRVVHVCIYYTLKNNQNAYIEIEKLCI